VYNVVDESARTDGNRWGGIQMFWGDEADTATAKKPKLRQVEQLLKKLIGSATSPTSWLEDAPQSQTLLSKAFQTELRFMLANGVFRGPGGGQMLGFLKGKGGVAQAIEATQTIANTNVVHLAERREDAGEHPGRAVGDVIFLYNQELLPYLINATLGGTSVPVFIGAGGMSGKPSTRSSAGRRSRRSSASGRHAGRHHRIAPSQYHLAEKGGAQIATSSTCASSTTRLTLRITYRVDGKPVWNTTVAPFKGTNARGFFSTLAVRV
jgi:hypothetical protein